MAGKYKYTNYASFELERNMYFEHYVGDEGEIYNIHSGKYTNDDGETAYRHSARLADAQITLKDKTAPEWNEALKAFAESELFEGCKHIILNTSPQTMFLMKEMPITILGRTINYYSLLFFVQHKWDGIVIATCINQEIKDDPQSEKNAYEFIFKVAKAIRIDGKSIDFGNLTASRLREALSPDFQGKKIWQNFTPEFNVSIKVGDREMNATYTYGENGIEYVINNPETAPDQSTSESLDLKPGVYSTGDNPGYVTINNDWSIELPAHWVYSSDKSQTGGMAFAAVSEADYKEYGLQYGDNCFIVLEMREGADRSRQALTLLGADNVIDKDGLEVAVSHADDDPSTYCQYVYVFTKKAAYTIQLFYTDSRRNGNGRYHIILDILRTICLGKPCKSKASQKSARSSAQTTNRASQININEFPIAEVEASRKRLLDRKPKKTDGPNRFDLHLISSNRTTGVELYYYDKVWPGFANNKAELLKSADEMVTLFRDDTVKSDIESELRQGYIRHGRTLHVLRSFVWTSVEYCKAGKEELEDFSIEQSLSLAQFIFDRGGANYQSADKKTKRIGAGLLTKSEKDHGYTGESYVNMIRSLNTLVPVMKRIHNYLSGKHDELSEAEITLKDILAGWCAFSLACMGAFKVEAGPEDLIPQKCRELPKDNTELKVVSGNYYVDNTNTCVAYTGSGNTIDFPEGIERIDIPSEFSHISGSNEYWNHTGKIIYPKSCSKWFIDFPLRAKTVIFNGNFEEIIAPYSSSYGNNPHLVLAEEVIFNGSGNTIASHAFSWYPNLKKVILPEDLTVIGNGAFFDTKNLKEVKIPPNVKEIGPLALCLSDKTLIVEKGSPSEAVVKKYSEGIKELTCRVVLSAAEQKRIEEENRLKKTASDLQQKIKWAYKENLDDSWLISLTNTITSVLHSACDRKTWAKLMENKLSVLPSDLLTDTYKRIYTIPPEESYDKLPEWVAEEYIKVATDRRQWKAFESLISQLESLSESAVLPAFESGQDKDTVLNVFSSRVKALIGDGAALSDGLKKYGSNHVINSLRMSLSRAFSSPEDIIDGIVSKKAAEYDRLSALLAKKNEAIEAIQQEKATLEAERATLGLFKGKRKKEIAAILEKIPERIKQAEDEYEKAKNAI